MDPLSVVLVTANLLAVVDNVYRGVQFLRRASEDPRVDGYVCAAFQTSVLVHGTALEGSWSKLLIERDLKLCRARLWNR